MQQTLEQFMAPLLRPLLDLLGEGHFTFVGQQRALNVTIPARGSYSICSYVAAAGLQAQCNEIWIGPWRKCRNLGIPAASRRSRSAAGSSTM